MGGGIRSSSVLWWVNVIRAQVWSLTPLYWALRAWNEDDSVMWELDVAALLELSFQGNFIVLINFFLEKYLLKLERKYEIFK